ncbi:MAG: glycosyltransferase [Actinomycetota bacterium]|nr:glycosyltransferase [Actinomycetota bacterium]
MILIVSYSGAFGGAERLLIDIAPVLGGNRILACPEGPLAVAARDTGLTVLSLPARSLRARGSGREAVLAAAKLAAHGREIRGLVERLDPELLLAWGMRSAIAATLGPPLRCPVAFQHNDLPATPAIAALVRATAARAALVVAPSRAVANDLDPAGKLGERVAVVHPGIDLGRFDASAPAPRPPKVLVLGALTAWKRPDLALEACALARERVPDLSLRLVGAPLPDDSAALTVELASRARAADLAGAVEMPGSVPDSAPELADATCLLHCAEREPFGLAVAEALAAGRPVVVPASGGPPEIVDHTCGLLYPPGDAVAAADAIVRLAEDPQLAAQLGAAGRERARREFDLEHARGDYAAALAPLLARRRARIHERPACSLLTVTHNSARDLEALLDSASRHLPGVRVIVVDCASDDESVAVAQRLATRTIVLSENVGFGRACNRGLPEVSTPVTILVNPDVELLDDSLLTLVDEARRRDRLLAPLVIWPDGSRQQTVHPAPTSAADLLRSILPPAALPGRFGRALAPWRSPAPRQVGWAVGCAIVARTETLARLGPFDERIFLYGEDLDLGLRAAEIGVETWFWPTGRVLHRGAHASTAAFGGEPFNRLAAARREVVARRLGKSRALLDDAAQAVTFASRLLIKRALCRAADREREQLRALAGARRRARA